MFNYVNGFLQTDSKTKTKVAQVKVAQTVQAEIGEKLWVSRKKDENFSRLWEVHSVASLSADKRRVFVADEVSKNIWEVPAAETLPFDHCHETDFDDLTRMNYLHEASLLNTLQKRYNSDSIYTFFGDTLLSINPYETLPGLYEKSYDIETPHVFSVALKSFQMLQKKKRSQSIVINGDSGAGKTENAKHIMRHLVSLCANASSGTTPEIENLVLESTPVLEAFGNSVTLRNDNSSRFGRYIQITYNETGTAIAGMNTLHFLLEKSRLIRRSPGERNYHIFYQCCAALKSMGFKDASVYNYLLPLLDKQNYTGLIPDDRLGYERTRNALLHIGITEDIQSQIWRILLAVLSLGNIDFVRSTTDMFNTGKCSLALATLSYLETVAQCLGISDAKQLESAMTQRTIEAGKNNEITVIDLTVEQARDSRDALAKFLYSAVFDWVVEELNRQSARNELQKRGKSKDRFIGILDIFGFESLEKNSFEQICVNYANELLQKQFDFYVIEAERRVFKEEGIEFPDIVLPSIANSEMVLELLTVHLFNILEEQCLLRSGNDAGFLSNLERFKADNDKFALDWKNKNGFVISHFAGQVSYDSSGFVEKNRDALTTDLKEIIQNNCPQLLAEQIGATAEERSRKMASRETVLKKFQKDMNNLVSTIGKTDQTFIRCIKPNSDQAAKEWDVKLILAQLEYLGIIQAIRVHQDTYPIRRNFSFIAEKYYQLLEGKNKIPYVAGKNDLEVLRAILTQCLGNDSEFKFWQCGHTKVFLGNEVLYELDSIVNQKRLAALAAMNEDERRQKLEEDRLRQERELKAAREKFEKEKKEEEERRKRLEEEKMRKEEEERKRRLEEEDMERRRKLKEDEQRLRREEGDMRKKLQLEEEQTRQKLKDEQMRVEKETTERLQKLKAEEERKRAELEAKESKLIKEEEEKRKLWDAERAKIALEEEERKRVLVAEQANFAKLSEARKKELEEDELRRKTALEKREEQLRKEEEETRKRWEEEQKKLDEEEISRRLQLKKEEEKLEKERETRRKALEEEESRIAKEKQRLVDLEKQRLKELEAEEKRRRAEIEERNAKILVEQKRLAEEESKMSALQVKRMKELEAQQAKLREEQERMEEERELRRKRLEEEEERLKAQEERLRLLEEDILMRLASEKRQREEEQVRKEAEEKERVRLKTEKVAARKQAREEKKLQIEKMANQQAKKARRKAKILSATKLQAMARGSLIRMRYKDMINRRRTFQAVLRPNELVVLSSLVLTSNSMTPKRRFMIVTSSNRVLLLHPGTLKIEDEVEYDSKFCKAVATGVSGNQVHLYLRKDDKQLIWKLQDLLNVATTWVAVLDNLRDAPTYVKLGFYKSLNGRVSRKNIVVPVKFGFLKPLMQETEQLQRASSRFSLGKKAETQGFLFLLTEQDKKYTLTWYESKRTESYAGQLLIDRRTKVLVPDTSSVAGHLNVFVFCLRVKKNKNEKLYTIQARGKDDRDSWMKVLKESINLDKTRKNVALRDNDIPTLKKNELATKKSFNAAKFLEGFQNSDTNTNQNLKHFGAKKGITKLFTLF